MADIDAFLKRVSILESDTQIESRDPLPVQDICITSSGILHRSGDETGRFNTFTGNANNRIILRKAVTVVFFLKINFYFSPPVKGRPVPLSRLSCGIPRQRSLPFPENHRERTLPDALGSGENPDGRNATLHLKFPASQFLIIPYWRQIRFQ